MKYLVMSISLVLMIIPTLAFAEPEPYEQFMEKYQPILDEAQGKPPIKQAEIGVRLSDITCPENKIHMLKLSANYVACIKESSAMELMQRGWGITKTEQDRSSLTRIWECTDGYKMTVANDKPRESEILKKFRTTIIDFSQEPVYWQKINVEFSDSTVELRTNGKFTEQQQSIIIDELETIDKVRKVDRKPIVCI